MTAPNAGVGDQPMIQIPRLFLEEAVPLLPAARDAVPVLALALDELLWVLFRHGMDFRHPPLKAQTMYTRSSLPRGASSSCACSSFTNIRMWGLILSCSVTMRKRKPG